MINGVRELHAHTQYVIPWPTIELKLQLRNCESTRVGIPSHCLDRGKDFVVSVWFRSHPITYQARFDFDSTYTRNAFNTRACVPGARASTKDERFLLADTTISSYLCCHAIVHVCEIEIVQNIYLDYMEIYISSA